MTQNATVKRIINSSMAEVEVQRKTACGGNCSTCGGACAAGALVYVNARNRVGAAVGDLVTVETRTSRILGAAALVYILPFAAFFLAYGVSALLGAGEDACMLISFAGFAVGVFLVVLINRAVRKKRPITYEITGII